MKSWSSIRRASSTLLLALGTVSCWPSKKTEDKPEAKAPPPSFESPTAIEQPPPFATADFGASGFRSDEVSCERKVVAKSPGAVGNPCMTTELVMKSIGLDEAAQRRVRAIAANMNSREKKLAH